MKLRPDGYPDVTPGPNPHYRKPDVAFSRLAPGCDRWHLHIDGVKAGTVQRPHPERAQYVLTMDGVVMGAWRSLTCIRRFLGG